MYWHFEICDKTMNEEFRNIHLVSKTHSFLINSIIRRYIKLNPTSDKLVI